MERGRSGMTSVTVKIVGSFLPSSILVSPLSACLPSSPRTLPPFVEFRMPATAVGGGGAGAVRSYPVAVASHEQVVEQPGLFWDTLKSFHASVGTRFMVPVIGGKELDLHRLYVEVTKRGGYDKVVVEKKWREISGVFEFSPTTTSASYVLKKHYYTYLLHYENVYFFRLRSPALSPMTALAAAAPVAIQMSHNDDTPSSSTECAREEAPPPPPPSSTSSSALISSSFQVMGTVDAKFDCGYMVSVKVGSQTLRGVLYHPPPSKPLLPSSSSSSAAEPSSSHAHANAMVVYDPNTNDGEEQQRRRRKLKKKKRRWGWDPAHPKPNRSGYNFFFAEKHAALKSLYPSREREFTKMIGEAWNKLPPDEKMVYQDIGLKDKERYRRELKDYKDNLKLRGQQQNQNQPGQQS